jgi:glycosyltransferase involved in cell wall biosynthesis
MLYNQYDALPEDVRKTVEIIYLIDNKTIMLGDKRNIMVDIAKGKYITFVDCDDRIANDYITTLLDACKSNCDSIVFEVSVSLNENPPKTCYYSKNFKKDFNTPDSYYRLPNHICCIKREVSKKVSFPSLKKAEDAGYAKLLARHLKTEFKIDKVLYYYDYSDLTTVAQEDVNEIRHKRLNAVDPIVDIIFISNASKSGKTLTQNAIDYCIKGANGLPVNCIVIEQTKGIQYKNAVTYNPDQPFNYNYYLNFGAIRGKSNWIMCCNNDLIFRNGWLHELLGADYPIVSPISLKDFRQKGIIENETGWQCGRNLSGWAFMISRDLYNKIKGFDNDFDFWFADNSLIEQLKILNIPPMLVPSSKVDHLGSHTLNREPQTIKNNLMWSKLELFNKKYNQNLFEDHPSYISWKKLQSA